ncbi:MAG: hypothetical protein WC998_09595 [Candidatus Paceibacterota bacterium]|jgi:hypothetical protein
MEYHIEKGGKYLTGNIASGSYEWTSFESRRYTFPLKTAELIASMFEGSKIVQE